MSEALAQRVADLERQVAELRTLIVASPRRAFMLDVIRFQLPKVLPELQRKHPTGVTAKHVATHFDFPIDTVQAAVKRLVNAGKVRRVRRPRRHETVLLLPGDHLPPEAPATAIQKRVLEGLVRLSTNGRLEMSLHKIALNLGMAKGTLQYTLECLILDKRVIVAQRSSSFKPSVYFIPSAIQGAA